MFCTMPLWGNVESYRTMSPGLIQAVRPAWLTMLEPVICMLSKANSSSARRVRFKSREILEYCDPRMDNSTRPRLPSSCPIQFSPETRAVRAGYLDAGIDVQHITTNHLGPPGDAFTDR